MPITYCCPYWLWEANDGTTYCQLCKLRFANKEERRAWLYAYCANNPGWQNCTVAKFITNRIEEGKHVERETKDCKS